MNQYPGAPTGIKAPHGAKNFDISWPNGEEHRISNAILRGYCPCAGCQGHGGTISYQAGHDSSLIGIEAVGNYALQLTWGDRHDTGIYTFEYLWKLGELQASLGEEALSSLPALPETILIDGQHLYHHHELVSGL
ncbi:MAG: DUF971 domain-containing protein [Polyangiaceae bacterium]|nr:DUF971 domain-containing protein [Polyangiaceae bacterium]